MRWKPQIFVAITSVQLGVHYFQTKNNLHVCMSSVSTYMCYASVNNTCHSGQHFHCLFTGLALSRLCTINTSLILRPTVLPAQVCTCMVRCSNDQTIIIFIVDY